MPRQPLPDAAIQQTDPEVIDLPVEAGVYTEQTARGAKGKWKRVDKVRFQDGLAEKIGGWKKVVNTTILGLARRVWDWASLDARRWVAIGTESKLYLYQNGSYFDITPVRRTQSRTDPFETTSGDATVTVTDADHGAQQGDYVRYSGSTTVGGLNLDGEFQITAIVDTDTYTIEASSNASSSATGGGNVTLEYDISVGLSSTAFGTGWGTGTWSQGTWNTPRTTSSTIQRLRTWALDNWGEDLIACPRRGGIYWWDRGTGANARAVVLDGAPERCNYILISQRDRQLFALGATDAILGTFDPLLIRWCSREDFNDWEPTESNTAGDLRLYRGSEIVTAIRTLGEILVFTDVSLHKLNYVGGSALYGISPAGESVSILGPNAGIAVDYRVFLMADGDFYLYDGVPRPIPCDVRNYVFENINEFQKDKVFAGLNKEFNEVWWFYPAKDERVYFETDFSAALQDDEYAQQEITSGNSYTIAFDARGYVVEQSNGGTPTEDHVWFRTSAAEIEDNTDAEYEVTLSFAATTAFGGIVVDVADLTGANDNITAIVFEIDPDSNTAYFRYRDGDGATQTFTNGAASYDLSALSTAVTIATGNIYALRVLRDGLTITARLYDPVTDTDQQVASFDMTSGEAALFTTGVSGALLAEIGSTGATGAVRLYSHRASPGSVISGFSEYGVADEVNRYVIFNYEENHWSIGKLARTAWLDRSPTFNTPVAAGTDSYVYLHETGFDDDGSAMVSFAETHDMELPPAGKQLMHVSRLIPDFLRLNGSVDITLKTKKYPQQSSYVTKGPYTITPTTEHVNPKARGRQVALRVSSDALGDDWRMGTMRADVQPDGER